MSLYNESMCAGDDEMMHTNKPTVTKKKSIRTMCAQTCSLTIYSRLKMFNKR